MVYIFSSLLIFINFISSVINKKNNLIHYALIIFMWILFWGNYFNSDLLNYKYLYDNIIEGGSGFTTSQIGLVFLMKQLSRARIQYYQFIMITSFFSLLLIANTVHRYAKNPQLVFILYFIYPFMLDIVQIKHFFAMSIVIFCFKYLEKNSKIDKLKFILGIILASSFHLISVIFLPLIIVDKIRIKWLFVFVAFLFTITVPMVYSNYFYKFIINFINEDRIKSYFDNRANYGFVLQYTIQIFILILIYASNLLLKTKDKYKLFSLNMLKVNIYLISLFPVYMINGTFERGFRMIAILNYIVFSNAILFSKKNEKILNIFILFVFSFFMFLYYIYLPHANTVVTDIFKKNMIFN